MADVSVWRERLGGWLHPVAIRIPVSADAITLLSILLCLAAALLFAMASADPRLFLVAPLFAIGGGLLDALDGIVARARGETSPWGDFLDHLGDRVSDGAMLAGWLIGSSVRPLLALPALLMILLVGYAGTQIEASFGRRSYADVGRGEFIGAMVLFPLLSYSNVRLQWPHLWTLSVPEWLTTALLLIAAHALMQRVRRARQLAAES